MTGTPAVSRTVLCESKIGRYVNVTVRFFLSLRGHPGVQKHPMSLGRALEVQHLRYHSFPLHLHFGKCALLLHTRTILAVKVCYNLIPGNRFNAMAGNAEGTGMDIRYDRN